MTSTVKTHTEPLLRVVSGHIEEIVPRYDRPQADVLIAIETGTGNCLAKAVIATIVYEHITQPNMGAVFFNRNAHPSAYSDLLMRTRKGFGHAAMLAQTESGLWTLGFNVNNTSSDDRYIVPANDDGDDRVRFENGRIVATRKYDDELAVGDWYNTYRSYMEAVDILDSSAHSASREHIREVVLNRVTDPPRHDDPRSVGLPAA